ncbi:hypothetical protein FHW36_11426 [Chitinophaga polysaccharea]|uniref:Lipoprotein n=1 Tax=Chitinophaga polysaccharea TaxID=1293035 RepID=A0A561P3F9_9BACT|nr:hypothetical protein [Chitinophaga polysaccharea]TWF32649.1 hypothetical protein FHW36_11426 [Chitinophaga polysaccharea]
MLRLRIIAVLLFCLTFYSCFTVHDKGDAKGKAMDLFNKNKSDFYAIGNICESFMSKYPKDTFELIYAYNSRGLGVLHRMESGLLDADGKGIFSNNNLGTSYDEIKQICDRNYILSIEIKQGRADIRLNGLQARGYEMFIVYTKSKYRESSPEKNDKDWCDILVPDYFVSGHYIE